jgi:hypothetical protein
MEFAHMNEKWTKDKWVPGNWNAFVEAGTTKEERARRLAECPEHLRASVEDHVRTVFLIRGKLK